MRPAVDAANGVLTHRQIEPLAADGTIVADVPIEPVQLQPTSLDLRLGPEAVEVRAGFLPGSGSVADALEALGRARLDLTQGAVLRRGRVYLVRLLERLGLPNHLRARANPRSSTGRVDVFTRTIIDGHDRFDDVPAGYHGPLWLEVLPLSFDVRVRTGLRLNQIRLLTGAPELDDRELLERVRADDVVPGDGAPRTLGDGSLLMGLSLEPDTPGAPIGWRARRGAGLVDLTRERGHRADRFFAPVHPDSDGTLVLEPEAFYILASRRRLRIPADLAAEMLPWDVGMGELRTNYAGFFDSGFGAAARGARAVLEVRAHDVPFRVEHGQPIFRLQFFRTVEPCARPYGSSSSYASAYQGQGLALARYFDAD